MIQRLHNALEPHGKPADLIEEAAKVINKSTAEEYSVPDAPLYVIENGLVKIINYS